MAGSSTAEQTARRSVEAFNSGDLQTLAELYQPDCEWRFMDEWSGSPVYRGHEGLAAIREEWWSAWEEAHVDLEEIVELSGGRLFLIARVAARGRESGVPVELALAQIVTLHDGLIARVDNYLDTERARHEAGLT
jgi:ketosteroid isomerase-like protein